ncbi:MAG: molecular chaperone HscC [Flavobacteriales bacterium]|jgi:molecular chaperone HscC
MDLALDLGSIYSRAAVIHSGKLCFVPNDCSQLQSPSVLAVNKTGGLLVGDAALERSLVSPSSAVANFVPALGTAREFSLGSYTLRAEELCSYLIRNFIDTAQAYSGQSVTRVLVAYPGNSSDQYRKSLVAALELAGVTEFLLNPSISIQALATAQIGLQLKPQRGAYKALHVDCGEYAVELGLYSVFNGLVEQDAYRCTADGVVTVKRRLFEYFCSEHPSLFDGGETDTLEIQLNYCIDRSLSCLGASKNLTISLAWGGKHYSISVDEIFLTQLYDDVFAKLSPLLTQLLNDVRLRIFNIDDIVLSGGGAKAFYFQRLIKRLLQRPFVDVGDPSELAVKGLMLQANIFPILGSSSSVGSEASDFSSDLLSSSETDNNPDHSNNNSSPSIALNSRLPYPISYALPVISKGNVVGTKDYSFIGANQLYPFSECLSVNSHSAINNVLRMRLFKGLSSTDEDYKDLGQISIGFPPGGLGLQGADIRVVLNYQGLLEVYAAIAGSSDERQIKLDQNPEVLSARLMSERHYDRKSLDIMPASKQKNTWLMIRSERLYQQMNTAQRKQLAFLIKEFKSALSANDKGDDIDLTGYTLQTFLTKCESDFGVADE